MGGGGGGAGKNQFLNSQFYLACKNKHEPTKRERERERERELVTFWQYTEN